jgi:hypothetical protein
MNQGGQASLISSCINNGTNNGTVPITVPGTCNVSQWSCPVIHAIGDLGRRLAATDEKLCRLISQVAGKAQTVSEMRSLKTHRRFCLKRLAS